MWRTHTQTQAMREMVPVREKAVQLEDFHANAVGLAAMLTPLFGCTTKPARRGPALIFFFSTWPHCTCDAFVAGLICLRSKKCLTDHLED